MRKGGIAVHTTVLSEFGRVFGTGLTRQGFLPAAGSDGVFARMTGSETVGIIALQPQRDLLPAVYCGIATLYCPSLETAVREEIPAWLHTLDYFYRAHYPDTWTLETLDTLSGHTSVPQNTDAVQKAAQNALRWTEQLVLPLLGAVTDLKAAIPFLLRYGRSLTVSADGSAVLSSFAEDLLCIKADYQGDFLEAMETRREYEQHRRSDAERGVTTEPADYTEYARKQKEEAACKRQAADILRSSPELRDKALAECELRCSRNLTYLRKAGILPGSPQGGTSR